MTERVSSLALRYPHKLNQPHMMFTLSLSLTRSLAFFLSFFQVHVFSLSLSLPLTGDLCGYCDADSLASYRDAVPGGLGGTGGPTPQGLHEENGGET